jgi:hypothetical protein
MSEDPLDKLEKALLQNGAPPLMGGGGTAHAVQKELLVDIQQRIQALDRKVNYLTLALVFVGAVLLGTLIS